MLTSLIIINTSLRIILRAFIIVITLLIKKKEKLSSYIKSYIEVGLA